MGASALNIRSIERVARARADSRTDPGAAFAGRLKDLCLARGVVTAKRHPATRIIASAASWRRPVTQPNAVPQKPTATGTHAM